MVKVVLFMVAIGLVISGIVITGFFSMKKLFKPDIVGQVAEARIAEGLDPLPIEEVDSSSVGSADFDSYLPESPASPSAELLEAQKLAEQARIASELIESERLELTAAQEKFEEQRTRLLSGFYVFGNRVAPEPPSAVSQESSDSQISKDASSNSWRWISTEIQGGVFLELARSLDIGGSEMDIDFVFVAVAQRALNDLGFTGLFRDGASYHALADLGFSASGLTLGFNSVAASISAQRLRSASRVVSSPFVRTLSGSRFSFDSVEKLPVSTTTFSDSVTEQSYTYRDIGLRVSGSAVELASQVAFSFDVAIGSVLEYEREEAPAFRENSAQVSGFLSWGRWSLVSGLRVESESKTKGIFSRASEQSSDMLLVFARPRLSFPAGSPPPLPASDYLGLKFTEDHLLLPPLHGYDDPLRALPVD